MELFVIAVLLTVTGAQRSQLEGPQNSLSIAGSTVNLKCSAPSLNCSYVDWEKYIPQTNPETVFSDRRGGIFSTFRDRYSVDNSSGCDLVIKNVKPTDAGRFICKAIISQVSHERSARLTILETQPKCAINASMDNTVEGDEVQLTCEVTYNGTDNASMMWKDVKDAPDAVENGKTISRSHSLVASVPEVPSFSCVTSFPVDDERKIEGLAPNVPATSCETPVIKVFYSVRNVTLSPSLSHYASGTNITCTASGNPLPSFKWQVREMENEGTWMDIHNQNRSEFSVSSATCRQYRCLAMNVVRGKRYSAASHELNIDELTSASSSEDQIGVGIGIGFGIGLLAAILLTPMALASLVELGCLEFHWRPGDVVQHMKEEKNPSSHQLSSINSRETAFEGQQVSAYASLVDDRDTNAYETLEQ